MIRRYVLLFLLALTPCLSIAQSLNTSPVSEQGEELSAAQIINQPIENIPPPIEELEPFGASLFRGGFSNDREDGLNPQYLIQPGDTISVRIWGATQFNERLPVDHQGNIFIPSVGPIMLAGVSNRNLNQRVTTAVASVYTDNVKVYTSLDGSQPVAVFVTGYVQSPGRFSGIPSNSVLYFLDRAGGIDPERGSYRSIFIQRNNKVIENIDLYKFLRKGELPSVQFQDGDTIVVGSKGSSIAVTGDVNNKGLFEIDDSSITGDALAKISMIDAGVSYVGISGIRDGRTVASYVAIEDFRELSLYNGDQIHFRVDQNDSMVVVDIEGSHKGPSRYAVPKNTRLLALLDYIEVDRELANVGAVSLKRQKIATRQKAALDESLQRLQSRYLTAPSQTDAESSIRTREAQLISEFVENARNVEPSGRLVVTQNGKVADVILQSGDTITIPENTESVLLSGEVLISQAILHQSGLRAMDYIERSGGFSDQADEERIVVVRANGDVSSGKNPTVQMGDEIIVLPKVSVKNLQIASTLVDIIYKIAVAASVAINL